MKTSIIYIQNSLRAQIRKGHEVTEFIPLIQEKNEAWWKEKSWSFKVKTGIY